MFSRKPKMRKAIGCLVPSDYADPAEGDVVVLGEWPCARRYVIAMVESPKGRLGYPRFRYTLVPEHEWERAATDLDVASRQRALGLRKARA